MIFRFLFLGLALLPSSITIAQEQEPRPYIKAQYYSADAVQALPRLKPLRNQDAEYNKILFKLENYPKHQEIILEIKRLASLEPRTYEPKITFSIQDDDSLLLKDSHQRLQRLISSSRGFLPGERVSYRFRTADGSLTKEVSGIPTPAVVKEENGTVALKAELISINPTMYKIEIPAMAEGEEYDLLSTSVGEIVRAKPKYSASQPLHYAPASGNNKGGEATLEIRRKSGKAYKITLPWGAALEGYLQGTKVYKGEGG